MMKLFRRIAIGALIGIVAEYLRERSDRRKLPEVTTWTKISDDSDPANY